MDNNSNQPVATAVAASYPHPIIAREGWVFIGFFLALSILVQALCGWWSLPFWVLFVFCVQFFRDPPRVIAGYGSNCIVAPADGRIVVVEQTEDPYLKRQAIKVSVFMNVFNVHSNRSPVDGQVMNKWYNSGSFFNAALDKASLENERCALHFRLNDGTEISCVQIAGLVARRILNYANIGENYQRGQRYGLIRFGSRVDLYLPVNAQIKVAIGDKVSASSTLIAELI